MVEQPENLTEVIIRVVEVAMAGAREEGPCPSVRFHRDTYVDGVPRKRELGVFTIVGDRVEFEWRPYAFGLQTFTTMTGAEPRQYLLGYRKVTDER